MSEKTTGPWVAKDLDANFIEINDAEGNWVGEAYSKANARLMIAAPDLLESLEKLHAILSKGGVWTIEDQKAAYEAIAKAKEEQG